MTTLRESELWRLAASLQLPRGTHQRRVEVIDFLDPATIQVSTNVALSLPVLSNAEAVDVEAYRLVSLGIFSKTRLPELEVSAADRPVQVVGRDARAKIIAVVTAEQFVAPIRTAATGDPNFNMSVFENGFRFFVEQIVKLSPDLASIHLDLLVGFVSDPNVLPPAYNSLIDVTLLRDRFEPLCHTAQLLCFVKCTLQETLVISFRYYGRLSSSLSDDKRENESARDRIEHRLLRLCIALGLAPQPFKRTAQNADHTLSYYLVLRQPPGAHVDRMYWAEVEPVYRHNLVALGAPASLLDGATKAISRDYVASSGTALASNSDSVTGRRFTMAELGLSRSLSISTATVIACLTAFASLIASSGFADVAGQADGVALFAFIPAVLLTAADRGLSDTAKSFAPTLMYLLPLSALLTAITGIALAFEPEHTKNLRSATEGLLAANCALAAFTGLVCGWIATGPRFGKQGQHSFLSSSDARKGQLRTRRAAGAWLLVSVVVAGVAGLLSLMLSN